MGITSLLLCAAISPLALAQSTNSTSTSNSTSSSGSEEDASDINDDAVAYVAWVWASIIGAFLIYRWSLYLLRHIRRLANLNHEASEGDRQRYFSIPNENWAKIKRHLLHAPLGSRRHNREFQLSAAMNVGVLPTRFQSIFLVGYLALNISFTVWKIDWTNKEAFLEQGLQRSGLLAVLNMIPLFLLAGRNNILLWLLDVDFDDCNLIHRWTGRICVLEAIAHAGFWMASKVAAVGGAEGWDVIGQAMAHSTFILAGTIGAAALIAILLQSPSIVRHAFYETFLHLHILIAITTVAAVWVHLNGFTAQKMLLAAIIFWALERFLRFYRLIRNNCSTKGMTKAEIEALPGDAVRVTFRLARPWKFRPGQHIYVYIPSIGWWTNHPFSLAWSDESSSLGSEKALPVARQDVLLAKSSTMSIIVRRRTGFTNKLYLKAEQSGRPVTLNAFVEGPYGHQNFQSYGTVMLFAAGVGITHQVPHVRNLVAAYANGTCATRKVVLVWIIQSPEHLEWIRPWMTQILAMEKRREILKILLFITRPRSTKEIHSPSASVQMYPGKPDCSALIAKEQEKQIGAMAISVCGTGPMSDDVRKAMRDRCEMTEIDFFEEAFSW